MSPQPRDGGATSTRLLTPTSELLSVQVDMHNQKHIAENVLITYLGPQTGPRVLAGQIRRGSGEATAALWSSDLRGFTKLSDHVAGEEIIAILDRVFDAQARAIVDHGGEILKFIGDRLLAIFPLSAFEGVAKAATNAMAAAHEALAAVHAIEHESLGSESRRMVVTLHYGTVIYGNIGAADQLDFTVIGPSVNSRGRVSLDPISR
jgi:adenylate cyclase